jgi:hypothetical protein
MDFKIKKEGLTGDALKMAEGLEAALAPALADVNKGLSTEDIDKLIDKALTGKGLPDAEIVTIKGFAETLRKQGEELDKLKAHGIETTEENFLKTLEDAKDELKTIQKQRTGMKEFVIKAPGIHTTATTGGTRAITNSVSAFTAQRLGDGPMNLINRSTPFVLDYVNVGNTNSSVLIWFDELPKEGDFAVTAEGAVKPMVQYRFERKSADYVKAAGYTQVTDEFERDFPGLYTTIRRLMVGDCKLKIAQIILTNLLSAAPTFSYTGLNAAIDGADDYAAIYAARTQAKTLYFNPNVLFLNPADDAKLALAKTPGSGELANYPLNDLFDAIIVDPAITAGTFLLGDLSNFNVDMYGDIIVKIGYINDDLIRNQFTVVVEQFFFNYISSNKLGGLVKGTFSTIKTALETSA